MGRLSEIMVRRNPQPPFFIDKTWVRVDFREIILQSKMFQDGLNEEHVCVTYNPQLAPADRLTLNSSLSSINISTSRKGKEIIEESKVCVLP